MSAMFPVAGAIADDPHENVWRRSAIATAACKNHQKIEFPTVSPHSAVLSGVGFSDESLQPY
jgi:hypothetical protein